MKIIISAEPDNKDTIDFILTNEDIETPSFIEILVEENSYMVNVTDLFEAVLTFQRIKDRDNNEKEVEEVEEKWKF